MQKQSFDLHDLVQQVQLEAHAAWRYRWHALILAWCVAIAGAVLVFSLPDQYQSRAQVYADTSALTNPLLHGITVQPNVRQRLKILTHTLKSRPNLEQVAEKTNLSLRATTPQGKASLLDHLGATVQVRDAGPRNLYDISYTDPDPKMSQKVVQAFLQILMNETLDAHTASTGTAQNFLQQQVKQYDQRLDEAQNKLAAFKQANVGYIPNQGGGSYALQLQQAEAQLQNLEGEYGIAAARRSTIRRQMNAMASHPGASGLDPRIANINAQIAADRQKLNQLLLRYTDKYPDVVSTRSMIEQLKKRRETLQQGSDATAAYVATDNPVFQARQQNLYANQVKLRSLGTKIALKKQQIARLKRKQAKAADVQASLQQLTRSYNTTKKQYNELQARLNTARISQAATQSGNNLNFRVVDPPTVPLLPSGPPRGWLLAIVFAFAVGMGALFAWFLHKIKPVFTNLRSLREFADVPVIGTFRLVESSWRRSRRFGEIFGFGAAAVLLAVVVVLGAAYSGPLAGVVQHIFGAGVT